MLSLLISVSAICLGSLFPAQTSQASIASHCNTPAKAAPKAAKTKAAAKPKVNKKKRNTFRLGPMLFNVKGGKVKSVEQLSVTELYQQAALQYQKKQYKVAIKLYNRILQFFPMDKFRYATLYNIGLAYEDDRQYKKAIKAYQSMIKNYAAKKQKLALNARFRIAASYTQLKRWSQAFSVYDKLLQRDLNLEDRIDALAYGGEALFHLNKYRQAIPLLRLAVLLHLRQTGRNKTISFAAAMAQYYHGRIFDLRFRKRRFSYPKDKMRQDLEFKAGMLLRAQHLYLQTLRLRHADWAMASLYRIGKMYEQMYQDMMKAPIPKRLNKKERALYTKLLKKKIKVLLEKALVLYERNLLLAAHIGVVSNDWKTLSEKNFKKILTFYESNFGKLRKGILRTYPKKAPASRPAPAPRKAPAPTKAPTSKPAPAPKK